MWIPAVCRMKNIVFSDTERESAWIGNLQPVRECLNEDIAGDRVAFVGKCIDKQFTYHFRSIVPDLFSKEPLREFIEVCKFYSLLLDVQQEFLWVLGIIVPVFFPDLILMFIINNVLR